MVFIPKNNWFNKIIMDEKTAVLTKGEVNACPTCNVAIQEDGSLGSVMPDFSGE